MSDFQHVFIVGAQRSGTTYLYHLLDDHPAITMAKPIRPEPKFFLSDQLVKQGRAYYESAYFSGTPNARVCGEKSTSYIESEVAAKRIARFFPNAVVIIAIRNPVERAISNYWFSVNNGLETLSLEDAIQQEETRCDQYDHEQFSVSPFAYLRRGHYINYLAMFEQYFSRDQIKVLIFEEFTTDFVAIQKLYGELGVTVDFVPNSLHQSVNASQQESGQAATPELREYLRDHFAVSNARLSEHLGLDLEQWGW